MLQPQNISDYFISLLKEGDVAIDASDGNPRLLFQLYSEKTLLDPAGWLKL